MAVVIRLAAMQVFRQTDIAATPGVLTDHLSNIIICQSVEQLQLREWSAIYVLYVFSSLHVLLYIQFVCFTHNYVRKMTNSLGSSSSIRNISSIIVDVHCGDDDKLSLPVDKWIYTWVANITQTEIKSKFVQVLRVTECSDGDETFSCNENAASSPSLRLVPIWAWAQYALGIYEPARRITCNMRNAVL